MICSVEVYGRHICSQRGCKPTDITGGIRVYTYTYIYIHIIYILYIFAHTCLRIQWGTCGYDGNENKRKTMKIQLMI